MVVERDSWLRDFALGVRLAVGGGRTAWLRLILGTIGIGLAVAVLLMFASVTHILGDRNARTNAAQPNGTVIGGVAPTQILRGDMSVHGTPIQGEYLHGTGPNSPVPPGLASLPGPNEVVVSPALANLLSSDAGARLRPRFPQRIVGTIGEAGLSGPADLRFYAGTGPLPAAGPGLTTALNSDSFGAPGQQTSTDPTLLLVALLGGVAVLIPIFIFVSVSSRIAGAQRDRRLAALRLVGAGNWQVRRIAAGESLVSAGAGIVLGALAFLGIRQLTPSVDLLGWSAFTSDVVPAPALTVLIVLLVPGLAVGTVLFAMRRIIIEPLGVVRDGKPVLRRVWWRVALIVGGIGVLLVGKALGSFGSTTSIVCTVIGASALLIGVPAILPWLLERAIDRVRGGSPSWQLAIRRLQLDSGTPARVVSGVAVVLAGAIALQLMLFASANQFSGPDSARANDGWLTLYTTPAAADEAAANLTKVPAAQQVDLVQTIRATGHLITIASCQTIISALHVHDCADGDGFRTTYPNDRSAAEPGAVWQLIGAHDLSSDPKTWATYTVPTNLIPVTGSPTVGPGPILGDVVLTPDAAADVNLPSDQDAEVWVRTDPKQADASDQIAAAEGRLTWQVFVGLSGSAELSADQKSFATMRTLLLAGSLFTLLLAGVSMLVLALEQVRERRRPLAVLAAAGVPRSTVARSLLWQTAVPVVLAVVVSVGTGIGLAALVLRMADLPLAMDWSSIGVFAAATVVLVFLVTGATLPALRGTMRLSALRAE
ncbi:MAG TPA: FtsX-like permease family protein [Pseudonocardiaceae bacterium]|jgi:hypothetical protein|nr:FtsX-like permease family protein [Pseudonocardiaceae bacterium]